jgi:hypothetical protein
MLARHSSAAAANDARKYSSDFIQNRNAAFHVIPCMAALKHVLRRLIRTPGFTITALVTLALGIGATTAVLRVMTNSLPGCFPGIPPVT